jgi:hypothetical protein
MGTPTNQKIMASLMVDARGLPLDEVPSAEILRRLRYASACGPRNPFTSSAFNASI